jgi:hypothetical protein
MVYKRNITTILDEMSIAAKDSSKCGRSVVFPALNGTGEKGGPEMLTDS